MSPDDICFSLYPWVFGPANDMDYYISKKYDVSSFDLLLQNLVFLFFSIHTHTQRVQPLEDSNIFT